MLRRIAMLMVALTLTTSTGCVLLRPTSPLKVTAAAEATAAPDLPIPEGFVLDMKTSRRHTRDGYRELDLTYRRAEYISEERVVEFFLKQMPKNGWATEFVYGLDEQKIDFTRGEEEATVVIDERLGDRLTEFRIQVGPRRTTDGQFVATRPTEGGAAFK